MYKPALCIELHDQKVSLCLRDQDYVSTYLPGRTEYQERTTGLVNVGDLIAVFDALGLGNTRYEDSILPKMSDCGGQPKMRADSTYLPLYTKYQCDCDRIIGLQCEIASPNMINILVKECFEEEEEGNRDWYNNITYCGSFTVWWAKEESVK